MTDKNDRESRVAITPSSGRGRRPYVAPKLRYLGSVRSLTLGGTSGTRRDVKKFTFRP
jgi:hypothetical protein